MEAEKIEEEENGKEPANIGGFWLILWGGVIIDLGIIFHIYHYSCGMFIFILIFGILLITLGIKDLFKKDEEEGI